MNDKIKLAIDEEYGYRYWVAYLDKEEYEELLIRWRTLQGLNCLVPVRLIIPQATLATGIDDINIQRLQAQVAKRCHIHESDDSYLEGSDYAIPEAPNFVMGDKVYTREEIDVLRLEEWEYCESVYNDYDGLPPDPGWDETPEEVEDAIREGEQRVEE